MSLYMFQYIDVEYFIIPITPNIKDKLCNFFEVQQTLKRKIIVQKLNKSKGHFQCKKIEGVHAGWVGGRLGKTEVKF